jgi:integrase
MKRRARGTGSIFFSERLGCWVGRTSGAKQQVSGKTQGDVIRKLAALKPGGQKTTVKDWGERWVNSLTIRESTLKIYRFSLRKYINPNIGHLSISTVNAQHIKELVKKLSLTLKASTLKTAMQHVRGLFQSALAAGMITANPAKLVRIPKVPKTRIDPFSPAELQKIIKSADGPYEMMFAVLAGTGCRRGEAIALEYSDIRKNTLSITKQRHGGKIGPPKSENSTREIGLPGAVLAIIRPLLADPTPGPLFSLRGKYLNPSSIHDAWRRYLLRLGLRYRTLHALRHSVGTALISAGVPLGDVARFLGDSVGTIVNTYLHPAGKDPRLALDAILKEPGKRPVK